MDGWMDGWMNEWMDGWIVPSADRSTHERFHTFLYSYFIFRNSTSMSCVFYVFPCKHVRLTCVYYKLMFVNLHRSIRYGGLRNTSS